MFHRTGFPGADTGFPTGGWRLFKEYNLQGGDNLQGRAIFLNFCIFPSISWSCDVFDNIIHHFHTALKGFSPKYASRRNFAYCLKNVQKTHFELTGQLGKFVQYEINDFCMCLPGFHVPVISDSDLFKLYTYRQPADQWWDGKMKY